MSDTDSDKDLLHTGTPPVLPLIAYPSEDRQVILQHGDAVVLYDRRTRQLEYVNAPDPTPATCPTCHRPLDDGASHERVPPWTSRDWTSPDYFALLSTSRSGSSEAWRNASPPRLLAAVDAQNFVKSPGASVPRTNVRKRRISSAAFSPNYCAQHFVEIRQLGHGSSGVVLLVQHVLDGNDLGEFALKRIPVGDDLPWLTKVLSEVQLLQRLRHPRLVAYMHVWLEHYQPSAFTPSIPHAYVLQQYCNAGDLHSHMFGENFNKKVTGPRFGKGKHALNDVRRARHFAFDQIRDFFHDITSGLEHLHANGFVHRGIVREQADQSDFGETTKATAVRKSSGTTGTVSYCAPEVLRRDERDPSGKRLGNFTQKCDIFSLGLIVHLLCYGRLPYVHADPINEANEDYDKLRAEIAGWEGLGAASPTVPRSDLSHRLREDLSRLLSVDPSERPTATDILRALTTGSSSVYEPPSSPNMNSTGGSSSSRRSSIVNDEVESSDDDINSLDEEHSDTDDAQAASLAAEIPDSSPLAKFGKARNSAGVLVRRRRAIPVSGASRTQGPPSSPELTRQPHLLLPPPEIPMAHLHKGDQPITVEAATKLALFAVKCWSVLAVGSPATLETLHMHSPVSLVSISNTKSLVPLLLLFTAGLDLIWTSSTPRRGQLYGSAILMVLHVTGLAWYAGGTNPRSL